MSSNKTELGKVLEKMLPEDLLKFGLIPEFVGRLPVIVTLNALDEEALMNILTEPKNALVKQYKRLFEMDGVDLEFESGALRAVAQKAMKRKTGARGLRAILEEAMLGVMYDLALIHILLTALYTEGCSKGSSATAKVCAAFRS